MSSDDLNPPVIDALQYCNWTRDVFLQMRQGGVDAVHVTVAYHEELRELIGNLSAWNGRFVEHSDLIVRATSVEDIRAARESNRTAILFGSQNPLPISDDIGLVEILHQLGLRFLQLTYNNQSMLGSGHTEPVDGGVTRFGRCVIAEMNRLGLVIDLSHAGARTARDAIEASARPVAITHANPAWWHDCTRNIPDDTLKMLAERGGMLGFSLYPHHLRDGSACTLDEFCAMVAEAAHRYGARHLGIGSDLCQGQPDTVVQWMREGRWTRSEPGQPGAVFPAQPDWFRSNSDFPRIEQGLRDQGLDGTDIAGIMGGNWMRFFEESFRPQ